MSFVLFGDDVLFTQRFLKGAGLYAGQLDGIWGPLTDAAAAALEGISQDLAVHLGTFDPTSERCIRTLNPRAQEAARTFMTTILNAGIEARIISGTRTYAEQNTLFKKGRFGNPPPRVTNARGGHSNHNFGIAWDVGLFHQGAYLPESPLYAEVARLGSSGQLEWGGDWSKFRDEPHYQLSTGNTLSITRQRFESGLRYV